MRAIQRKSKFHIDCVIMILPEFIIKGPFTTEPRHRFLPFLESMKRDIMIYKNLYSQLTITCSKLRIEILEQGLKYVQS